MRPPCPCKPPSDTRRRICRTDRKTAPDRGRTPRRPARSPSCWPATRPTSAMTRPPTRHRPPSCASRATRPPLATMSDPRRTDDQRPPRAMSRPKPRPRCADCMGTADPPNVARYYWGLMLIQNDRPDSPSAFGSSSCAKAPRRPLDPSDPRQYRTELAWEAGVEYQLPEVPPRPSPARQPKTCRPPAKWSAEERQRNDPRHGLEPERTPGNTEGGSAEEWARLIGAYGVLGERTAPAPSGPKHSTSLPHNEEALAIVRVAAQQAGDRLGMIHILKDIEEFFPPCPTCRP